MAPKIGKNLEFPKWPQKWENINNVRNGPKNRNKLSSVADPDLGSGAFLTPRVFSGSRILDP